jgi:hypothetical protein
MPLREDVEGVSINAQLGGNSSIGPALPPKPDNRLL